MVVILPFPQVELGDSIGRGAADEEANGHLTIGELRYWQEDLLRLA